MKRNHLSLAIGLILGLSVTAHAQDNAASAGTDEQTASAEKPKGPATLDKVTVTARRREETLQDVPVAVTAFTPDMVDKLNIRDLGDLDAQVPNLTIYAARGNNTTITAYIRGVGQSDPLWGVDPGVGLYLDDVYIARPQGGLLDVFDIGRVEVLRGPQGTLYGKNTVGGAIKYISRELPTKTEGSFEATAGTYGQVDFKGAIGGAAGGFRYRIAAASLTRDGFGENINTGVDVSDKDTKAVRLSLGFFPEGGNFDLKFSADHTDDNSGVRGAQMLATNRFDPSVPDTPPLADRFDVRSGMFPDNSTTMSGAALTATWRPNDSWTLKSITAWRKSDTETSIDFDTLPAQLTDVHAGYHDKQLSQELQAAYDGGGKSRGVLGLYWFDGQAGGLVRNIFLKGANLPPFFPNPPGPGFPGLYGDTRGAVDTRSIAIYGDWSYAFTDKLSLSGGLRWTREEKAAEVLNRSYSNDTFTTVTAVAADFEKSITFTNLSPKISLDYKVTDDVLLYGLFARGFKSGGFNIRASALPITQLPYDDESVDSIEIGSKMSFFDQRMFLNLAYFDNKYKDIQLSVFTSCVVGGVPIFCADFTNAGKGSVRGLELEMQLRPNEHWFISGNLARLDAKFDEYMFKGVNIAEQQEFTNAPDFSGAINVEYRHPVGAGELSFRVGYSYQSDVVATTEVTVDPITHVVTRPITQDGYGLVGAGIIWKSGGAWTVSLQGSNLADKEYLTTGYVIPTTGVRTGFYGNPRQISLSARYEF
jgi:iron complex outermembrane receptor protein